MPNRLISASAGTGKTHRLAIEYISLLVKNINNPDFHFSRILVITFTRKAAAEIRNKIFNLLEALVHDKDLMLLGQLESNLGIKLSDAVLRKLEKVHLSIKTQKDKVRISTIDSLVNQVFKSMIAPIMKLSDYTIDEGANYAVWEQIFEELVREENISILKSLNDLTPQKDIETLGKVFSYLIENRWIYHSLQNMNLPAVPPSTDSLPSFSEQFISYCECLHEIIINKIDGKAYHSYFTKIVEDVFCINQSDLTEDNFLNHARQFAEKGIYKLSKQQINNICSGDNIKLYNGNKIRKDAPSGVSDLVLSLLNFMYNEYVLKESLHIINIWDVILTKYDKIKLGSGALSYSDISWYTYLYLYSADYSIVDLERLTVENQFYEFLTVRNQYLLIDEFQDTSLTQFMILAPMINELSSGFSVYEDTSVIIVGDEKQSIYGWRGGVRELLSYMETFLNVKVESLKTCYRSVPVIVNFVNELFTSMSNLVPGWDYPEGISSYSETSSGSVNNHFYHNENKDKHESISRFVEIILNQKNTGDTAILARTNSELEQIASVLKEFNIPYTQESSLSIFSHPIVASILLIMNYIQFKDPRYLLEFNKSDLSKYRFAKTDEIDDLFSKTTEVSKLCKEIIVTYNLINKNSKTIDVQNIDLFFNIISDFYNNPGNNTANLEGFLRYAQEISLKNQIKQMSLHDTNSITLLTIHKSKGLGFDTVYLYFDVSSNRSSTNILEIDYLVDTRSFNQLSEVFLCWNYKTVIKELFKNNFNMIRNRKDMEELNTFYVALTRAKTNLCVYWLLPEKLNSETLKTKLCIKAMEISRSNPDLYSKSNLVPCESNSPLLSINYESMLYNQYFDIDGCNKIIPSLDDNVGGISKSKLYGSAVHTYLSYIHYNTDAEHKIASMQLLRAYGNIFSEYELEKIQMDSHKIIFDNQDLYSEKWDKVFNELTLIVSENKSVRLDRLMIDSKSKKILIIDYKTGAIMDSNQIDYYKTIVSRLPILEKEDYDIEACYVSIM